MLYYSTELIVPRFLTVPQLSREDIEYARKLSSARIHVERVIGELRNFRMLSDICPVTMLGSIDDVRTICAAIVNMNPPIVPM